MAPLEESKPERRKGQLAFADQAFAETLLAARRRLGALEQLDEQLRKPPSSLGWAVKT